MHLFHDAPLLSNEKHLHACYRAGGTQRASIFWWMIISSLFISNSMNIFFSMPAHANNKIVYLQLPMTPQAFV